MTAALQQGVAGFLARYEALRDRLPVIRGRARRLPMRSVAPVFPAQHRAGARRRGNTPACAR
jgi:hypothetical protein